MYDKIEEQKSKKFRLGSSMIKDDFNANIFDANFVNTHFTNYYDEI